MMPPHPEPAAHIPYAAIVPAPFRPACLGIRIAGETLCSLDFLPSGTSVIRPERGYATEVVRQLMAYFRDPQWPFTLQLALDGTVFQGRVWQALRAIPSGETRSYGELAATLNTSARAAGGACRANPVPIIVPCHRVVAVRGPGGYGGCMRGAGIAIKRWLLAHESH